ncbi:hypothetical protein BDR26DRAFT_946291 [Obelidium mucronatum]|nr:hypothetical protein BDR26DRAFT_946291 [Obelidium mucronatum]
MLSQLRMLDDDLRNSLTAGESGQLAEHGRLSLPLDDEFPTRAVVRECESLNSRHYLQQFSVGSIEKFPLMKFLDKLGAKLGVKARSNDPRLAPQRSPQPGHAPTPPLSPRVSLAPTDARPSTAGLSVDVDADIAAAITPTGTPHVVPVVLIETHTEQSSTGTLEDFVDKSQLQTLSERSRDVMKQLMTDWNPSEAKALLDQFEDRGKSVGVYKDKIDLLLSKTSNINELTAASATVKDTMDTIVNGLGAFADTHPILKIAWFLVSAGYKMAKARVEQAAAFDELSKRFLDGGVGPVFIDITLYSGPSGTSSLFGGTSKTLDDLNKRLDAANADLGCVKQDGTLEVLVAVAERVQDLHAGQAELLEDVAEIKQDGKAHTAKLDEVVEHIAATSQDRDYHTLRELCRFTEIHITDERGKNIVWLLGEAGTGKSVIAGCVANALAEKGVLAASFFCQHTNKLRDSVASMIQTLGYELASKYPGYRKALIKSLQDAKFRDSTIVSIRQQLEYFFINPFNACPAPPGCVIVLDALDELLDHKSVEEVLRVFKSLKTPIKLFITSRPDVAIPRTGTNDFGIEYFDADGLFIWITLVLGNVHGVDRHLMKEEVTTEVIEDVWGKSVSIESTKELVLRLEQAASMDLHSLYCQGLYKAYKTDEAAYDFKVTIGIILHAKVPLSLAVIEVSCGATVPEYLVKIACHSKCESPINACVEGASRHCCHNQAAGRFQIDSTFTSLNMALACLNILNSDGTGEEQPAQSLFRNMGKLNGLVKNPVWSVATTLSEPLQYAVTYWSQHFADTFPKVSSSDKNTLLQSLLLFSKTKLPYYLEALLLLGKLNNVFEVVATVTNCLSEVNSAESIYIKSIFRDLKFVAFNFRSNSNAQSTSSREADTGSRFSMGRTHFGWSSRRVDATAVSSDGRTVVSGSWDNTVKLWSVTSVAISFDGQTVVSGSSDKTVKLWSVETGECIKTLVSHSATVTSVAISFDGQTVVSGSSDKTVKLWSVETGECIKTLVSHSATVTSVAISFDGQTVVSGSSDKTVKLWSVETGECIKTLVSNSAPVTSVAISFDGQTVVSGSRDKTVKLWSVETGECIKTLVSHSETVTSVAISFDGQTVVSGSSDKTVKLWSVETGECIKTLVSHSAHVTSVAISFDGQTVVSGSSDKTVKLWSVETGECIKTLVSHSAHVTSVAISFDGQTVVSGSSDKTVKLWSVETGEVYQDTCEPFCYRLLQWPSHLMGKTVVSGSSDKTVKLWSVETGECIKTLVSHFETVTSVAISFDGQTVVSGSWDNTVKLWAVGTGECIKTLVGHSDWVTSVAISFDGQTVVSGSSDKTVKLWSVETGECIKTLDGDFQSSITIFGTQFGFITFSLEQDSDTIDKFQRLVLLGNEEVFLAHKNVAFGYKGNTVKVLYSLAQD